LSPNDKDKVACWETAALARYINQIKVGDFVKIVCKGMVKYKKGRGWDFDVFVLDNDAEKQEAIHQMQTQTEIVR
jgi:hypothetical protein